MILTDLKTRCNVGSVEIFLTTVGNEEYSI